MKKPRTGTIAWVATIGGILLYEVLAPDDELMSEAVDRALTKYPWTTRALIATLGLHLANLLPERIDPLHHLAKVRR